MARKHLFIIVVLLGAAAVAGLLAMTRTSALGSPASASPSQDSSILFRLKKLDRLEASLQKRLTAPAASSTDPVTVYRRAVAPAAASSDFDSYDEHEHEHEHGEDDGVELDDRDD
jgi:hypothetical protein